MKKETQAKLKRLALHLGNKWGMDFTKRDDFSKLSKKESDKIGLNLHYVTLKKYESDLKGYILSLRYDTFSSNPVIETVNLEELVNPLLNLDDVDKVIVYFKSGNDEVFTKTQPTIWSGLFEYRQDGVYIRCGEYKGCNIHSSKSLKQYFRNYIDLYGYIVYCLSPKILGSISNYRNENELEMNIKTLTDLKDKIETRTQFPTTLKQIRKRKGVE
jgi:hypothetical protein